MANRERLARRRVREARIRETQIEMAAAHPLDEIRNADASIDRHGTSPSPSILGELGGETAEVAALPVSVTLMRGEAWGVTHGFDAALVVVEEGFVVVSTHTCHGDGNGGLAGRRIVLATGQRGVLLPPPAPGERLEALTPSLIQFISADGMRALLGLPSVAEAIANAFAEALRDRQATIRNCAYVRHSERVFEKLLQLARTYGRVVPGAVRIDFPLTHQLLADMVGSARETVSLALSELAREGLLDRQQRRYALKINPNELFSTQLSYVVPDPGTLRA
ncbi:MAG TPA: Crp/Fnr family transcriptional regulator [Dehalococcoidia bacterium]|nr:Crp/Fnr family transcriptional regulator [Dehalococcoidia bacterium]